MAHTETHLVEIAVPVNGVPDLLTYSANDFRQIPHLIGRRVSVNVGHRKVVGVIVNDKDIICPPGIELKPVDSLLDDSPVVTQEQIALCRFVADYYFSALGEVIRLCLPPDTPRSLPKDFKQSKRKKKSSILPSQRSSSEPVQHIELTDDQQIAVDAILNSGEKNFLLQGVTGSGKTEIYIDIVRSTLAQGKSALVIVPEIALTPQLLARFSSQLETPMVSLHSGLTHAQRRDAMMKLSNREVRLVIGARSALFAPLPELGLIVVDEEHDPSLKQEENPRYHGRDVALWRGNHENAMVILGSATPSLESQLNVERGKLRLLSLPQRIGSASLPVVELVDLKSRSQHQPHRKKDRSTSDGQPLCILSGPLKEAMSETLVRGEQIMLFLNRRGYAAFALCDACGQIVQCSSCSIGLTYHQKQNCLRCHQCNFTRSLSSICPSCSEGPILHLGLGTERVEKEVQMCFPNATVARLDRDVARKTKEVQRVLSEMQSGRIDVLIGTQMIAKGHDFPGVALVGVILADTTLAFPDFRASERTFQMLTQVAGRAGRRESVGRVIIQTFNPSHPALCFAKNHDVEGFTKIEAQLRKQGLQPPYVRAALLRVESMQNDSAQSAAQMIQSQLKALIGDLGLHKECHLMGPAVAPIERLRNKSRWHIYIRSSTAQARSSVLKHLKNNRLVQQYLKSHKAKLIIDIDPVQML